MSFLFFWPWMAGLLVLPVLVWLFWPVKKEEGAGCVELRFPHVERVQAAFGEPGGRRGFHGVLFLVLLSLLWGFLVLALMRPQLVDKFSSVHHEGYDLMLAVDLSGSMKALDFSSRSEWISRLDVTKAVVGEFVREREGDRVGLVLFGDQAFLQVPLTLDSVSVVSMLENAVSGMAGDATAIGDAIGLSVRHLRERPEGSRVIILLTDGADTASSIPPLEAAKLAASYGIRVYTIGVGKSGRVPFPDGRGGVVMANMSMDPGLLKEISALTDGQYFLATDSSALAEVYERINELEKSESEVREYLVREPLFRFPLGGAVFCLLLLPLFLGRRSLGV